MSPSPLNWRCTTSNAAGYSSAVLLCGVSPAAKVSLMHLEVQAVLDACRQALMSAAYRLAK